jgi:hypothetical protein
VKSSAPCHVVAESLQQIPRTEIARRRPGRLAAWALASVGLAVVGLTSGCRAGDSAKREDSGTGTGIDAQPDSAADSTTDTATQGTGGQGSGGGGGNTDSSVTVDSGTSADARCSALVEEHVAAPGAHTDNCAPVSYSTNPPCSGTHYGTWPAFKVYDAPVPWGYLVHGLEHGAVVISYNCPDGCPEDLAAAKAFVASLPNKAGCTSPSVILSPEPSLDVRFGASAWNDPDGNTPKAYTLRASCFDRDAFARFYTEHVDRNYESTCGGGDWSSNHWCPPGATPPCGSGC